MVLLELYEGMVNADSNEESGTESTPLRGGGPGALIGRAQGTKVNTHNGGPSYKPLYPAGSTSSGNAGCGR